MHSYILPAHDNQPPRPQEETTTTTTKKATMSSTPNNSRYEHIIRALQGLGDNAAAAALIRVFEEQCQCPDTRQVAQEPAGPFSAPPASTDARPTGAGTGLQQAAASLVAQPERAGSESAQIVHASRTDSEHAADTVAVPNPAHVHIDTVAGAVAETDEEKPTKAVAPQLDSAGAVQSQQMPSSALASMPATDQPEAIATPSVVSTGNDYVTLGQFVAFLATLPGDTLVKGGGLLRVAVIDFDVTRASADALKFGHTIKTSHTHDINDGPIPLGPDFNAISLDGNTATARRLCEVLEALVAVNPSAGVCVADNAVKLEGAFSFATDARVRFHDTSLNPAHALPDRNVIRDAIALASRCVESGISCGEVLSMLARRIPAHERMGVLHLVALKDGVVTAKQVATLFRAFNFTYADVPAGLFVEVDPVGECPLGFKDKPHISMGRLPMTWNELKETIADEDELEDLDDLPRYASGRPWKLPLF